METPQLDLFYDGLRNKVRSNAPSQIAVPFGILRQGTLEFYFRLGSQQYGPYSDSESAQHDLDCLTMAISTITGVR